MIISHSRKFIFIKTKKVAGTSTARWLEGFLGDEDENYVDVGHKEGWPFQHATVDQLLRSRYAPLFTEYYTFTILRHPFDRMISEYFWSWKGDFWSFLQSPHARSTCNWDLVTTGKKLAPFSKIVFWENLLEGLGEVAEGIGIPPPEELPRALSGYRKDKRPWREFFSQEQISYCRWNFPLEVELHRQLGYKF